jgi:hypothetical protein
MIQMYLQRPDLPAAQRMILERARDNPGGPERKALDTLLSDPNLLREFRKNPDLVRRALEAQQDPRKVDSPDVQRLMDDIKKRQEATAEKQPEPAAPSKPRDVDEEPSGQPAETPNAPGPTPPAPPAPPDGLGGISPLADGIGLPPEEPPPPSWKEKMVDALEHLRDPDGPLAKSPALREAMQDLSVAALDSIDPQSGNQFSGADLDRQMSRWGHALRRAKSLTAPARNTVRELGVPSWIGVRGPRLGHGLGHLPSLGVGGLAGPSSTSLGVGAAIAWLVVIGALAGVLWQVVIRYQRAAPVAAAAAWKLGPWPVEPGQVATREELVRAFEYLSLLRLGQAAQSQNHREVAAQLGGDDARQCNAAAELADIYEQARYAPVEDVLPEDALAAARRDLCLLAGVATA